MVDYRAQRWPILLRINGSQHNWIDCIALASHFFAKGALERTFARVLCKHHALVVGRRWSTLILRVNARIFGPRSYCIISAILWRLWPHRGLHIIGAFDWISARMGICSHGCHTARDVESRGLMLELILVDSLTGVFVFATASLFLHLWCVESLWLLLLGREPSWEHDIHSWRFLSHCMHVGIDQTTAWPIRIVVVVDEELVLYNRQVRLVLCVGYGHSFFCLLFSGAFPA